jgi:hypothetical protein
LLPALARAARAVLALARAGVAELPEDLAQPVVNRLQHRRVLIEWPLPE